MKTVHEILNYLWTVAPEEGKEPWDNVGHLVGRRNAEVDHILVSLDITMPVIQEAAEKDRVSSSANLGYLQARDGFRIPAG